MTPDAESTVTEAATRLAEARRTGVVCAPVRELIGETNQDDAYAVQELYVRAELAAGRRAVGRKIGLTSRAVQEQFGVAQPDFGVLFDHLIYGSTEPIGLGSFLQPRVEGEIAFVLNRDLDSPTTTVADVLRATDYVLPAIEVVDSRIAGWDIRITDTIADNASSGAVVLGTTPFSLTGLDLADVGMVIEHRGEPVSVGAGSACLGSPVNAVAWLAREVARRGSPLMAGEVILSGALGPMVPVTSPGRYRMLLGGMGRVDAVFIDSAVGTDLENE